MAVLSESMEDVKSARNVDKNLLDLFWNLVETSRDVRCNTALGIINLLYRKQESFAESTVDATCPELKYSVERLVKGISSYRKAARQGYTLLLTEILKLFPMVAIKEVLSLMKKHLPLSNKQEKSQMIIGQLLAYSAIVRSGRMKDDVESLPTVVVSLYLLSSGKTYIQETTYKLMSQLFSQISEQNFKETVWPEVKKRLTCGWETCLPDMFWFLLLCLRMFPDTVSTKFLQKNWGCEDILASENFENLQKVVKKSTSVHPQFSPVCLELLQLVLSKKKVSKFWNAIFDEVLFQTDQSEKTYLGFKVVKAALSMVKESKISSIISPNFSSVITRCLLSNKHPMNSAALELASFLGGYVKANSDPHIQIVILKAFIQPPGTVLMEQMLNKKEVIVVINNLSSEAVKLYYEELQCIVLQKPSNGEDQELLNPKRCQAFSQIGSLVSHLAVVTDIEWRLEVIKFLFLHSFFEIKSTTGDLDPKWIPRCGSEIDSLDPSVRQVCMHSFNRAVDSLIRKTENSPSSPLHQQVDLLKSLVDYAQHLLESSEQVIPLQPLDKIQEPWDSMMHTVKKLTKQCKKGGKTGGTAAFQIFLMQLGLQLFSDAEHIPAMLEELEMCCKKALKMEKNTESASDEPPWIQVFVDLLLSLISQESRHMRCVVNSVFSVVHPFVTQDSIQQILDIIDPEKAASDILMESTVDEDVEFESGSSSEEEEENEENEKSMKGEDLSKLKLKVQEALGAAADVSDADSEEVLTDSEMCKLDDALSEAFRMQSKVGHLQFSTEEETLMHFRIRCLDLISIYLKNEPPISSVLRCVIPLLSTYLHGFNSRHQQPLSQKAHSILQQLVKVKKFQNCDEVEFDEVRKILQHLIEKASKETRTPVGKLLHSLCVYMVLCEKKLESLLSQTENETKESVEPSCLDQYKTALNNFASQVSCHLTPHMFIALMNSRPETAWSFVKPLQDCAFDNNIRLFKRAQCLGLLLSALRSSKGQKTITSEMWHGVFEVLLLKAVEVVCSMLGGESEIKPMYITELLDVIITVLDLNKEKCSEQPVIIENKEQLLQVLTGLGGDKKKRFTQQGKRSINKLIRLLGGEIPKQQSQKKRKVSEEGEVEEENKKVKKKRLDKSKKGGKKNKLEESNESLKESGPSKSSEENNTTGLTMNENGSSGSSDSEMRDS